METLTLPYGDAYEVACNLKNSREVSADMVLAAAQEKARELDLKILSSYCTGPTESELLASLNSGI